MILKYSIVLIIIIIFSVLISWSIIGNDYSNRLEKLNMDLKILSESNNELSEGINQLEKVSLELKFLEERNTELEDQIIQLEKELLISKNDNTNSQFEFNGGLLYEQVLENEKVRLIPEELDLLLLPYDGARVLRPIEINSLVQVFDKVSVCDETGGLWYYVSIPVYDTPMDYKGWIKVEDTIEYNNNTQKMLQSDVQVRVGAKVFETFEYYQFDETDFSYISTYQIRGRIDKRKNSYVRLSCPGGLSIWVHENDIIYPEIPISQG